MSHPVPMFECDCKKCRTARATNRPPDAVAMCSRCGHDFMFWHGDPSDVFYKVRQLPTNWPGMNVCPDCIEEARADG